MKEKVFEKVTDYIDAIAAKLGVAAEHVYGILVRQQYVEGITRIIACVLIVLVALFIARKTSDLTKSTREQFKINKVKNPGYCGYVSSGNEDFANVVFVLTWALLFVAIVVSAFIIPESIAKLINPEYYAIKEILSAIGGK